MKMTTLGRPAPTKTDDPVFSGDVTYSPIVAPGEGQLIRAIEVVFGQGGKTKWHHHECDQLLVITDGHGQIVSRDQTFDVRAGDVVFIPAGEVHYHAAYADTSLTHVSVLTPGGEFIDE